LLLELATAMSRNRLLQWILCLLIAPVLGGCSILELEREEQLTFYVAAQTVECTGVATQQCLLVRQVHDAEWTLFYDGIEGFTYEPGFIYTLEVERRIVHNSPADGSSMAYRLLWIIARVPEPGT
jgi:hypothetical protein